MNLLTREVVKSYFCSLSKNSIFVAAFAHCVVAGFMATICIQVPLLGGLMAYASAMPLVEYFPELRETGTDVEYYFLSIMLKTPFAWIAFIGYYSLIGFPIFVLHEIFLRFRRRKTSNKQINQDK